MSLQRTVQIGGWVILGALAVALAVAGIGIQQIRLGGPQHHAEQTLSALESEILPCSLYLVEPWLEATLAVQDYDRRAEHLANLDRLRREYEERKAFWSKADETEDLRDRLADSNRGAEQFWKAVDSDLMPAIRSDDEERVDAAHARLEKVFQVHKSEILTLASHVKSAKDATEGTANRVLAITLVVLTLLAGGIVALVVYSRRYLQQRVIDPLAVTSSAMSRMADGDLAPPAGIDAGRTDEIGALTRALEVFRLASIDQRKGQEAQRNVVLGLSEALDRLAEGDLTHTIDTPFAAEYEALRQSYNHTIGELAGLMQGVSASARGVANGSGEIRAAADDLALRNEQQAASLEETAAAMNQVTVIVRDTAQGAARVQQAIEHAHREATDGGATVRDAIGAMHEIEQGAREITQIINVIDGIAFQTNLLALNAGVEAARAGDAGKGFAVVANEVRALAQRSADAARDIKALITNSTEQVEGGVRLVNETGELLGKIVTSVGEISASVTEIARATESQSVSLEQVNAAIGEMDRMTQQNAAMVEESTAAARSLAEEASTLSEQVTQFRTGAPAARVATLRPRQAAPARPLPTRGNLALRADPVADADDWSEF